MAEVAVAILAGAAVAAAVLVLGGTPLRVPSLELRTGAWLRRAAWSEARRAEAA